MVSAAFFTIANFGTSHNFHPEMEKKTKAKYSLYKQLILSNTKENEFITFTKK